MIFFSFKGLKQYLCSECPEIFFNKGGFTSHVERKHRKLKKEFKCDICPVTFNEKKAYVMHMSKGEFIYLVTVGSRHLFVNKSLLNFCCFDSF